MFKLKTFFKLAFCVCICILITVGFIIGYFYNYKENNSCTNNPFIYGIKEMNKLNNANFFCTCSSTNSKPFYFNEEVMKEGYSFED